MPAVGKSAEGGMMSRVKILLSILSFYLFFTCVSTDRCSYDVTCLCLNETISCFDEDLFVLPYFTSLERRYIVSMDMRKTRLREMPTMSRFDWPYLRVSVC